MSVILDSPIPEHFFAINNETNEGTLFIFIFPGGIQIQEEPLDLSIQTRHEENSPDNRQPYNMEYVANEENQHFSRNPNSPAYSSEVRSKSLRPHSSAMKKPMVVSRTSPTVFGGQIIHKISIKEAVNLNFNASTASTGVIQPVSISKNSKQEHELEVRCKSLSLNSINLRPHSSAMKKPMVVFHVPPTYFDGQINNTISSVNRDTYRNINASTASTSVIHPFSLSKNVKQEHELNSNKPADKPHTMKKKKGNYSREDLSKAVQLVISGQDTPVNVTKQYGIPRRSLFRHLAARRTALGIPPKRKTKLKGTSSSIPQSCSSEQSVSTLVETANSGNLPKMKINPITISMALQGSIEENTSRNFDCKLSADSADKSPDTRAENVEKPCSI